jgi:hypothetical protein
LSVEEAGASDDQSSLGQASLVKEAGSKPKAEPKGTASNRAINQIHKGNPEITSIISRPGIFPSLRST